MSIRRNSGLARTLTRAPATTGPRRIVAWLMPADETSTRRSTHSGSPTATSAAMKPPIELPTRVQVPTPSASRSRPSSDPVVGDRDRPRRHRTRAEPGQVEGDRTVAELRHPRHVLEPVLPAAPKPVDEDDRLRPVPDLGVVDRCLADLDRSQVLLPIDSQPGGLGVAVGILAVGRGDLDPLDPAVGVGDGSRRPPVPLGAFGLLRGHAPDIRPAAGPVWPV